MRYGRENNDKSNLCHISGHHYGHSDMYTDCYEVTNMSEEISMTSQHEGAYQNQISIAITRVVGETPAGQSVELPTLMEAIIKQNGTQEVCVMTYKHKKPNWLWKRLAKKLPRKWCGRWEASPIKGARLEVK